MKKQELTDAELLRRIAAVFLDELKVMQRPTLRTMVSAAAAAELERQRGGERRKKKKEEGPAMPIYKEIGERAGVKIEASI